MIEWPKGSVRVGEKEDGTPYKTEMKADYGYVDGTDLAPDDGRLDVYIGPNEDAEYAYAIEQLKNDGSFDEWKVMLGFDSLEEAEAMYLAHNDEGWEEDHVGDITEVPLKYLFDLVEENTEKPIEKEATQVGMFDDVQYRVESSPNSIGVTAVLRSQGMWGVLEVGKLHLMHSNSKEHHGFIYDIGISKDPLEKRHIDPETVWEGMYTALINAARNSGFQTVSDYAENRKHWKNVGATVLNVTGKEMLAKIAGEHSLVEAFIKNYEHEVDFYQEVASLVQDKLDTVLQDAGIKAVVSSRAKRPSRLAAKLEKRAPEKGYHTFRDIYDDIVDLAGCRVALYMPQDRDVVGEIIQKLFNEVRPVKHFPKDRGPGDSLGYVADHYLVTLKPETLRKKELRYADTHVEIQVASVLMHAWAEVTHDLIYKPEKGELTYEELKILKDLNDLVQMGESQLVKLQNAIEGRTSEDLRFDIVAALQRLAQPNITVDEFRLQASKIAATAPAVQPPQQQRRGTEGLIYMWPEGYSEPRIMQGRQADHYLFTQATKAYPNPVPKQYYDEAYRGYAVVDGNQKRITIQPSENTMPYLKTVPAAVVQQFQKRFPGYDVVPVKSQWASFMRARLDMFKARKKADELDDRLRDAFGAAPAPAKTGPDDPWWYEALKQIGQGKKFDELTKEEQQQVIALAQTLKSKA